MQELSRLFGTVARVKLIRFFLANENKSFDIDEIEEFLKIKKELLKKELVDLEKSLLIVKDKEAFKVIVESARGERLATKDFIVYKLNKEFRFLDALRTLMFDFKNADRKILTERFRNIGRGKLLILSGVFIGNEKSRADIFYVGEYIKNNLAEKLIAEINSEVGMELRIEIIDLEEFNYRYRMFDRFVRDLLEEDNEVLFNKLSGNY